MKKHIESFAKYAGIATVAVEWSTLFAYYLLMPAYFGNKYPISYFEYLPQTRLVFNICYTLAGVFFWIFFKYHLNKYYRVPVKILTLSTAFIIALALIPFNPNNYISYLIHDLLGWSSAILFIIGIYGLAKNAKDKFIYRVSLTVIIISTILVLSFIFSPKNSNLIFLFEAGSWLVWQIWMLWISYYSYKNTLLKK